MTQQLPDLDPPFDPEALTHGTVDTNGITLHYVEQGTGPLVVFCHGFPESWYSWRHQLPVVAAAGFRAVAMSMRGYGRSDAPQARTIVAKAQGRSSIAKVFAA